MLIMWALFLTWCGFTISEIGWETVYNVNVYKCSKNKISECGKTDRELQGKVKNINFTEEELGDFKIQNLRKETQKAILWKDIDLWNKWLMEINWREVSVSKTESSCRTYDISLDLTYFDRATAASWEINKYLMKNRIERLKDFLKGNNDEWLVLENWDRIILRFIGLLKHWWVGTKLADITELYLWQPCLSEKTNYIVEEDLWEINDMLWEIDYFYILWDEEKSEWDKAVSFENLDDLMKKIESEFYDRYWKMSEWTYMLDHLLWNMPTIYKDNYITLILSDFLFQISPEDIKALKSKYCTKWSSFCNDAIYEFSIDNISKSYKDKYFFKSLFTNYIFEQLPSLNNLCPKGENWEKMKVYLLWIDWIAWISIQDKIKDFYENYLLKNCKIFYK